MKNSKFCLYIVILLCFYKVQKRISPFQGDSWEKALLSRGSLSLSWLSLTDTCDIDNTERSRTYSDRYCLFTSTFYLSLKSGSKVKYCLTISILKYVSRECLHCLTDSDIISLLLCIGESCTLCLPDDERISERKKKVNGSKKYPCKNEYASYGNISYCLTIEHINNKLMN